MSKLATLYRHHSASDGTWGILVSGGLELFSLELPWKSNKKFISCVPYGTYVVDWIFSSRFDRETYRLIDVPNRSGILFHPGNTIDDLDGCIALGKHLWRGGGSWAVADSGASIQRLEDHFERQPWVVRVTWEEPWRFTGSVWTPALSRNKVHRLATHAEEYREESTQPAYGPVRPDVA